MYRVNERVKNGGRYLDDETIRKNFDLGLKYLEHFADRINNLKVINTSGPYVQLFTLLEVENQNVQFLNEKLPERLIKTISGIAEQFRQIENKKLRRRRGPHL